MIQTRAPTLLIAFAFVATATAQVPDQSTRVVAGGVTINVPAIDGFQLPIGQERSVSALVEPFIIPKNRLLAALLTSADIRLFAAGIILRKIEGTSAPQLKRNVRRQVCIRCGSGVSFAHESRHR